MGFSEILESVIIIVFNLGKFLSFISPHIFYALHCLLLELIPHVLHCYFLTSLKVLLYSPLFFFCISAIIAIDLPSHLLILSSFVSSQLKHLSKKF